MTQTSRIAFVRVLLCCFGFGLVSCVQPSTTDGGQTGGGTQSSGGGSQATGGGQQGTGGGTQGTDGGGNRAPVAVAGVDQNVLSGATVTLDGRASTDPDGDLLTYTWTQMSGAPVSLANGVAGTVTFTAATVTTASTLVFRLKVSDGSLTNEASMSVTVNPISVTNHPPVASVTAPSSTSSGSQVSFSAAASSDPDGDALTFVWTQTAGPNVTLTGADTSVVGFTAPQTSTNVVVTLHLVLSDGHGGTAMNDTSITVLPPSTNHAPVADAGVAQTVAPGASVTLAGSATDPDNDAIASYAWTQTGGPAVSLSSATVARPTFTAPQLAATATLGFSLTAVDSKGLSSAPVATSVTVQVPVTTAKFTKVVSLHSVTRSSVVVFFLTDVPVVAVVDYGLVATTEHSQAETAASTRHVITLSGLNADTTYKYTVHAGTASSSGTFVTAFDYAANPKAFSFAVVGDARSHTVWQTVAASVLAKNPRFIVQTGDNNDAAGSSTNWEDYYLKAQSLFANVPVFAAQGNHDTGSNWSVYNVAPQTTGGSDTNFAFVYGNAGFVAIDTNASKVPFTATALGKVSGGPLFAFHHHPLYSCGLHGSSTTLQSNYQGLFESNHVSVDFTGHDHDLIVWSTINNVRYVVAGGGGTSLYPLSSCQGPFSKSAYGFSIVTVDHGNISHVVYDQNGTQLYNQGTFAAAGESVNFANLAGFLNY